MSITDYWCKVEGCETIKLHNSTDYCSRHHWRFKKYGDPLHVEPKKQRIYPDKKKTIRMVWNSIKQRCYNKNCKEYSSYGGRGIALHEPWMNDFDAFYKYIGPKPRGKYSIDRIDNDGNYEPGNLRWATQVLQSANRRLMYSGVKYGFGKYHAFLVVDGITQDVGRFDTYDEAHLAYNNAKTLFTKDLAIDNSKKLRHYYAKT